MSLVPLFVIAFSTTSALVTEFLQWFLVWRTPGFKALKNNLKKHSKKADEAKEASAKNLKKREQRLENWRKEAGKQVAQFNTKAGLVVSPALATRSGVARPAVARARPLSSP